MNVKQLQKSAKILTNLPSVEHKKPKTPNKTELNKKFIMRLKNNKPAIIEV